MYSERINAAGVGLESSYETHSIAGVKSKRVCRIHPWSALVHLESRIPMNWSVGNAMITSCQHLYSIYVCRPEPGPGRTYAPEDEIVAGLNMSRKAKGKPWTQCQSDWLLKSTLVIYLYPFMTTNSNETNLLCFSVVSPFMPITDENNLTVCRC